MIDAKRLDELEVNERKTLDFGANAQELRAKEVLELIALARLGIWAREHWPAIYNGLTAQSSFVKKLPPKPNSLEQENYYEEALAALPKDEDHE